MSTFNEEVWIADDPFGGARLQDMEREPEGTNLSEEDDDGFTSPYLGITHPNNRDPLTGGLTGGSTVPDYSVRRPDPLNQGRSQLSDGRTGSRSVNVQPRYLRGDHKRPEKLGIRRDVRYIAAFQQQLVQAGILDQEDMLEEYGVWDSGTWGAAEDLLSFANVNGLHWTDALSIRTEQHARGQAIADGMGDGTQGAAQGYLAPDYDTIIKKVEDVASRELGGRELRDHERKLLADKLGGLYDQNIQQQIGHNAEVLAARDAGSDEANVKEEINPDDSFEAFFKERYSDEIEVNQDREELQANTSNLLRNLTGADAIMGG